MLRAVDGALINISGLIQFSGTAEVAIYAATEGSIVAAWKNTTIQLNDFIAKADVVRGLLGYYMYFGGTTFTGKATGRRYYAGTYGVISTGLGAEGIPDTISGIAETAMGGYYE
ncbi:hypothetical protein C4J81_12920 [Deltaproteobacteria bacterium Smac51]|nr:hypothetical protein C4J81_12920 [Deltaproteobacteria bacterium Smac51]